MKAKIIGLTGGIGSGKTTMAKYFASLGIPVYIADDEAKKILDSPAVVSEITDAFGNDILTAGRPDRARLAALVFSDKSKLERLNQIIHPKVAAHFNGWLEMQPAARFVMKEAAILFESGSYKDCDKIILVKAPLHARIQRVVQRDGTDEAKVLERIENQWSDDKKEKFSDFVIVNEDLNLAKSQADKIVKELLKI